MTHWQHRATCRTHDNPELWYSDRPEDIRQAQTVCLIDCPVRRQCFAFALQQDEKYGVWGGVDMENTARVRRRERDAVRQPLDRRWTTDDDVTLVLQMAADGRTRRDIAERTGISATVVNRIITRDRESQVAS